MSADATAPPELSWRSRPDSSQWRRMLAAYIAAGVILSWLVLHPLTMAIYWLDLRTNTVAGTPELWRFLLHRFSLAFTPPMMAMGVVFALIGGATGLAFASFHRLLFTRERALDSLRHQLIGDLPSLIAAGENELVELKSSARWDSEKKCVNKALEQVVARALSGLLNHRGGSLVVGVADDGEIVGLEADYRTLKRQDRDGFEQLILGLVKRRLGGDLCPLVHVVFGRLKDRDVCRIVVEPSHRPVFCRHAGTRRLYVRMGNSTQALDVQEAIEHANRRWPSWG